MDLNVVRQSHKDDIRLSMGISRSKTAEFYLKLACRIL